MPRIAGAALPKYRKHRASGQAIETISGQDHHLGPWKSKGGERGHFVIQAFRGVERESVRVVATGEVKSRQSAAQDVSFAIAVEFANMRWDRKRLLMIVALS